MIENIKTRIVWVSYILFRLIRFFEFFFIDFNHVSVYVKYV